MVAAGQVSFFSVECAENTLPEVVVVHLAPLSALWQRCVSYVCLMVNGSECAANRAMISQKHSGQTQ
jgi:hypothetical protein